MVNDNGTIEVRRLTPEELYADQALWSALSTEGSEHVQRSPEWLSNIASHALDRDEQALFFAAGNADGDTVILPLKLNRRAGRVESLGNFYTSDWAPIVPERGGAALLAAILSELAADNDLLEIRLGPLREDSPARTPLLAALEATGWTGQHNYFCFGNWYHLVASQHYADYMNARPSQLRNTVARRTRQFLDAGGKLEMVTGGPALESAITDFTSVYQASWKRPEPYIEFIPGLARLAAERGWLRLGIARLNDRAIAAQLWLVAHGTAYIFKLAYREDAAAQSPGTVLTGFMLEAALDSDRVHTIDYLSGDDRYKRDWMTGRREYHGIAAYNGQRFAGRGRALLHKLKSRVKGLRARN